MNMNLKPDAQKGFTLVEMLIALAVGSVVMISICTAYVIHQRSHVTEQLVVDMVQNARAAMALMKREIRMMGYDPAATDGVDNEDPDDGFVDVDDADESAGAGILIAEENQIHFSADLSYRSDQADITLPDLTAVNENIIFNLSGTQLRRNGQIVAYDIEAMGFAYAFDDDNDGALDVSDGSFGQGTNGNIIWAIDANAGDDKLDSYLDTNDDGIIDENDAEGGVNMTTQVDIDRIRAIRIFLLARTRHPIKDQTDNKTYVVGANHRGPVDGDWDPSRRRVLLTTTIYCRNMGI